MQDAPRRYPYGMQDFAEIREGGYVYVDKTRYIHKMASTGKYYFLARPRRFGKTLLISTMQAYFEGRRHLFEGLAINELEPQEWESYPVIRLGFSAVRAEKRADLMEKLDAALSGIEKPWGLNGSGRLPGVRLQSVIEAANEQTGKRVVVLVDEYDTPMLSALHDPGLLKEFRGVMRELYSPLKELDSRLRFVFLAGITKFSQLSIFSELNNIRRIGMESEFAGICGITQEELELQLSGEVEMLGNRLELTASEAFERLKDAYDGYHFCWPSPDVYNPFSLISAFEVGAIESHWFDTATPTSLVNMIMGAHVGLQDLEGVEAMADEFDAPTEQANSLIPFMYQSGYLTIKGYDPVLRSFELGIPNGEVRDGLVGVLLPRYAGREKIEVSRIVNNAVRALYRHHDFDGMLRCLTAVVAGHPNDCPYRDEHEFENVFYAFFAAVGVRVRCEERASRGTVDAVVEVPGAVFIVELKYSRKSSRKTAEDALADLRNRGYLDKYRAMADAGELELWAAGVVYDAERRCVDENWIVERVA